jgi:hypothetical protein
LLASSLCVECKALLDLKAFADAIRKLMPLDENLEFTNTQYLHPDLKHLYMKVKGLRAIIEQTVSGILASYVTQLIMYLRMEVLCHASSLQKPS